MRQMSNQLHSVRAMKPIIVPVVHAKADFDGMRAAGKLTAQCLREVGAMVRPGITTQALDDAVAAFCGRYGAVAASLGYNGFPAHCCTSVNHVVAHGIPNDRWLTSGDIVKLDVCIRYKGWHGDACETFPVGYPNVASRNLIDVAREAMYQGIRAAGPLKTTGDIGHAISTYVTKTGLSVVEELCGHGIGRNLHDVPNVQNVGKPGTGTRLMPGMFLTVEPMVNIGSRHIKELKGGIIVTRDRRRSAQFEHTIGITEEGVEIFTL